MSEFSEGSPPKQENQESKPAKQGLLRFFKSVGRSRSAEPGLASPKQEYQRPTFSETKQAKNWASEKAGSMRAEEIHEFTNSTLISNLSEIASLEMPLPDIPKLYYVVEAVLGKMKHQDLARYSEDIARLSSAKNILYSVIMNEGLSGPVQRFHPPPDKRIDIDEKESLVLTNMRDVFDEIKKTPELYGKPTREIYEGITGRLNSKKSGKKNDWSGRGDFPSFSEVSKSKTQLSSEEIAEAKRLFLTEFKDRFKGISSWNTPIMDEKKKLIFRNWGLEAESIYGAGGLHIFSEDTQENNDITGFAYGFSPKGANEFIKGLKISRYPRVSQSTYSYLENGNVLYAQTNEPLLPVDKGIDRFCAIWRDGNFAIEEIYESAQTYFKFKPMPEGGFNDDNFMGLSYTKEACEGILLKSRRKIAEKIVEDRKIRIQVTQESSGVGGLGDKFSFKIGNSSENRAFSAINLTLEPSHPQYHKVLEAMQGDPDFFQSIDKVNALLGGIHVDPSSLVYYGFKDGEHGSYNKFSDVPKASAKIIKEDLSFEKALKIAFPQPA